MHEYTGAPFNPWICTCMNPKMSRDYYITQPADPHLVTMVDFAVLLSVPLDCMLALCLLPTFAWDIVVGFSGIATYALISNTTKEERDETEQEQQSIAWLALKVLLALLVVPSLVVDIISCIGQAVTGVVVAIFSFDFNLQLRPKLGFKSGCLDKQQLDAMAASPS